MYKHIDSRNFDLQGKEIEIKVLHSPPESNTMNKNRKPTKPISKQLKSPNKKQPQTNKKPPENNEK